MTDPTPPRDVPEPAPPVPSAPPPPPPPPTAATGWGPPGKIRTWWVVAVLTIVTCGIYGLFWQYSVFRENKDHSHEGVGGAVGLIFAIFVGVVNLFLLPTEIKNIYEKAGQTSPVRWTVGLWNLIPLVGWLIWLHRVQTAINQRWEQMGATRA